MRAVRLQAFSSKYTQRGAAVHKRRRRRPTLPLLVGWALLLKLPRAVRPQPEAAALCSISQTAECVYAPRRLPRARCHLHKTNFLPEFFKLHHSQPASQRSLFLGAAPKLFISLPQCVLCLEGGQKSCTPLKLQLVLRAQAPCPWAYTRVDARTLSALVLVVCCCFDCSYFVFLFKLETFASL